MRNELWRGLAISALFAAPLARADVKVAGFADVSFEQSQTDSKEANGDNHSEKANSFFLGDIDLFLASSLGDNFSWLSETAFSAGDDNHSGIDVERLVIKYSPMDIFNVSAGRFHTALGYWNDTYHHGRWFQTPIMRPIIYLFEDEGGILPIHTVGLEVRGLTKQGFGYIFNVGNGRGPTPDPVQINHDADGQKAYNLLVYYNTPLNGLRVGAGYYKDSLPENKVPAAADGTGFPMHEKGKETIVDGHLVYKANAVEFINEYHKITHKYNAPTPDYPSVTTTITSFFSQLAYTFKDVYTPYFRDEMVTGDKDNDEPYLGSKDGVPIAKGMKRSIQTFGIRYDVSDMVSLKAEIAADKQTTEADSDGVKTSFARANVAWAF